MLGGDLRGVVVEDGRLDSAVEAALACAAEEGTVVTIAYRGEAFNRVKPANRDRLEAARSARSVEVLTGTDVARIAAEIVVQLDARQTTASAPDLIAYRRRQLAARLLAPTA